MLRAVLFDKDGTLVDLRATWVPRYRAAARVLARAAGRDDGFALELLRRLGWDPAAGRLAADSPLLWATNAMIAERWAAEPELAHLGRGGIDPAALALAELDDEERHPPQPLGDVAGLLSRLAARGLALGLATMDSEAAARRTAEKLGIAPRLAFLAGCDSGHGLKPAPGMVRAFCRAVGVEPEAVALVGDSPADLAMARAAGCGLVVAVRSGGGPPETLAALADHLLESVHELEDLLDRLAPPRPHPARSCSRSRGKSSAKLQGR
ncbi:MAG: HAD family hydrolase [Geminicoccaceae bacterium]|nr:HAD family hydrolase [Geminicoccaceae bacterium]